MSMRLPVRWSSFPIAVALAGCSAGGTTGPTAAAVDSESDRATATESCATAAAETQNQGDYLNVVYRNGVTYIAGDATTDADFGAVVGRVRCTITGSFTPADYEGRDGDATYIQAGDALHQVGNRPPSEAFGAYLKGPRYDEGNAYIFVSEQEYRERSAGRCDVPLTQACPP